MSQVFPEASHSERRGGGRRLLGMGAVLGFTGVLAGTFGAHGLKGTVSGELLETFEIGVRYHLIHAIALIAAAGCIEHVARPRMLGWSAWLFATGVLVFSGSLYVLAITGYRWLGMITPFGGVALLLGWVVLAASAINLRGSGAGSTGKGQP